MIDTFAAVLRGTGELPRREPVSLADPGFGEVRLRMAAAGVCYSDVRIASGDVPIELPAVVGHEGAGVVEAVGPGVAHLKPGDHVIQFGRSSCGVCDRCRAQQSVYCRARSELGQSGSADGTYRFTGESGPISTASGLGTFAERTVCYASACVKVPDDVDLTLACLLSCGATTGLGAALRTADVKPGENIVVFGVGGVGSGAIQGAVIGGAAHVIAVDTQPAKEEVARLSGATAFVNPREHNVADAVRELTDGNGAAKVLLCQSAVDAAAIDDGLACLDLGGTLAIVGGLHDMDHIQLPPREFHWDSKRLVTCFMGGMDPINDIPMYVRLLRAGRLRLDHLVSKRYQLTAIGEAYQDLEAGKNVRGVVVFDHA